MNDIEKSAEIENLRGRVSTLNAGMLDLKYALAKAQMQTLKWRALAMVSAVCFLIMVLVRIF